jgi:iron-sulfur cluster repair protein YtfE (RIC family)
MRDPIQHLLDDHVEIMAEIAKLRAAVADLEARGDAALASARPALAAAGRMMATRLLAHARKEDEALFPAVEEVLGADSSPTAVMREEHREIHAEAARFRETLRELNEVEHPAIVAGGASLRRLTEAGAGSAELARTGAEIVRLLDLHFGKEEQILFPMCRDLLSPARSAEIARHMEAIAMEAPGGPR